MPMFGFHCTDCGATFEEWVRSANSLDSVTCPECGSQRVQKQLSRVAALKTAGGAVSSAPVCSTGGT